ncbi:hypothetical protein LEP1GSC170_1277, partial [Leptospira interrogans serovar Bataviae str. HAI135]
MELENVSLKDKIIRAVVGFFLFYTCRWFDHHLSTR